MKHEIAWASVSKYQLPHDMRSDAEIAAEQVHDEAVHHHLYD